LNSRLLSLRIFVLRKEVPLPQNLDFRWARYFIACPSETPGHEQLSG